MCPWKPGLRGAAKLRTPRPDRTRCRLCSPLAERRSLAILDRQRRRATRCNQSPPGDPRQIDGGSPCFCQVRFGGRALDAEDADGVEPAGCDAARIDRSMDSVRATAKRRRCPRPNGHARNRRLGRLRCEAESSTAAATERRFRRRASQSQERWLGNHPPRTTPPRRPTREQPTTRHERTCAPAQECRGIEKSMQKNVRQSRNLPIVNVQTLPELAEQLHCRRRVRWLIGSETRVARGSRTTGMMTVSCSSVTETRSYGSTRHDQWNRRSAQEPGPCVDAPVSAARERPSAGQPAARSQSTWSIAKATPASGAAAMSNRVRVRSSLRVPRSHEPERPCPERRRPARVRQ
jgi:hypothetical protein